LNGIIHVTWGTPSFWIERFPLFFGREIGLFQKQGVYPEIRIFHGGPELLKAVRDGDVHIGEIGLPPFIKAFSEGLPARIIGSTFIQQLDHYIAALPDISSLAELRGKRIGILSHGSCDEYFLHRILNTEMIDPQEDVEIVPLGDAYGDLKCFLSGRIDAGFLVEPMLSQGESNGLLRVVARVGDYFPRYQWGGIFATEAFIKNKRDLLESLLNGYRESVRRIREDTKSAAAYGSLLFKVEKKVFHKALERNFANWEMDARIDMPGLENCLKIQKDLGAACSDIKIFNMVFQL